MHRIQDMRDGRNYDSRYFNRMRGEGPLAHLIRMRFDNTVRKLGLDRERPALRTDLFVKPAPATPPARRDRQRVPGATAGGRRTAEPDLSASPSHVPHAVSQVPAVHWTDVPTDGRYARLKGRGASPTIDLRGQHQGRRAGSQSDSGNQPSRWVMKSSRSAVASGRRLTGALLVVAASALAGTALAAETVKIYRSIMPDGSVVLGDKPTAGARSVATDTIVLTAPRGAAEAERDYWRREGKAFNLRQQRRDSVQAPRPRMARSHHDEMAMYGDEWVPLPPPTTDTARAGRWSRRTRCSRCTRARRARSTDEAAASSAAVSAPLARATDSIAGAARTRQARGQEGTSSANQQRGTRASARRRPRSRCRKARATDASGR